MDKEKTTRSSKKRKQEKGSASKGEAEEVAAGGEVHQIAAGEHPVMAFLPWNALAEHRPIGGINRLR